MAVIRTRESSLAITVETTEGTPIVPSAAGQYLTLQPGATMSPNSEDLTNDEIRRTLAPSKPIIGRESATGSFPHYLKASGVEGQAPETDELLTALFGTEEIESTEYDTVAGSTTSVINVDSGEGANFARGQGLLIKDPVNGYRVRNVLSIATDALTLGFNLSNAPGTGVNLGKAVFYSPSDTTHQTLSAWHYLGDGGGLQLMSGARVTQMAFTVEPGALINATYDLEGLAYYFNPITIDSDDIYIDWTDDAGTFAATVTAKTYKDPNQLAEAIQSAMNGLTTETITCTYSNTAGTFTIATSTSTVFSLLWSTGANTANTIGDAIGFATGSDDTGATSYTADNAISFAAPQTPSYDSSQPLKGYYQEVLLGSGSDISCILASNVSATIATPRQAFDDICAESGFSNSIVNARNNTVTITKLLEQYEAKNFERFREGDEISFCLNVGQKDAQGNWIPGTVVNYYLPTVTIRSFNLTDLDGLIALEMEIRSHADSAGNGECYMNLL